MFGEDRGPRVQQVADPRSNARAYLVALSRFLERRLFVYARAKQFANSLLDGRTHPIDRFRASWRSQLRLPMPGEGHERAGKPAIKCAGRERSDAGHFHRAVEGRMKVT